MRVPFIFFCSPAISGLSHSSQDLQTLIPSRALNAANTQVAVNAATGNVFIRDTVFSIKDHETVLNVGMVFNFSDKRWQFAAGSRLSFASGVYKYLPQKVMAETISLTEEDGRVLQYTYDGQGRYLSSEGDQTGKSFLVRNADKTITRRSPDSGIQENYSETGTLINKILPGNVTFTYHYNSYGMLSDVILPSGRKLSLEADPQNTAIRSLKLTGLDTPLAIYETGYINNPAHLTTTIPQKNNSSSVTTYALTPQDDHHELQIKSSDDTNITLNFDAAGEIKSLLEGTKGHADSRSWSINLDKKNNTGVVLDADKNAYTLTYDNNKNLQSFKSPADIAPTQYQCNARGQVLSVTEADQYKRLFTYGETAGLLASEQDEFNTKSSQFKYNIDVSSVLFGAKIAEMKNEGNAKTAHFFVYTKDRQLAADISPEGRVTRFFYSNTVPSQLIAIKKVTNKFYDMSQIDVDKGETYPSLEQMDNWWNGLTSEEASQLQVTTFQYDANGRMNNEIVYATVDEKGNGVEDARDNAQVKKTFDERGRATVIETSIDASTFLRLTTVYDNLGRVLETREESDKSTVARITTYDYSGNTTTITHANGLVEKHQYDEGGLLAVTTKTDVHLAQTRSEQTLRHANGSVKIVIGEDGLRVYDFPDADGRVKYRISPDGNLKEHEYDVRGLLTCVKSIAVPNINPEDPQLDIPALMGQNKNGFSHYQFYDEDKQCRFEVTVKCVTNTHGEEKLQGTVLQHVYQLGNRIRSTHYHTPLTETECLNLSYATLNNTLIDSENVEKDRETRYFHDKDGLLVGEQQYTGCQLVDNKTQFLGFIKQYARDAAGNIIHEINYLNQYPLVSDKLAVPDNAPFLVTSHWYDNAGRKIATLDADKILTRTLYTANSKIKTEIKYADQQNIDTTKREITFPEVSPKDEVITREYDEFDREQSITHSATGLQINVEYDLQDNELCKTVCDIHSKETRKTFKEFNQFSEITDIAPPRVAQKSQWIKHNRHPVTGLILSTTDALGHATHYYYGQNRQPVLEIRSDGAVTQTEYDILSGKPSRLYHYEGRLPLDELAKLAADTARDGFYDASVFENLLKKNENDQEQLFKYDAEGLLIEETAANSAKLSWRYNSFNEPVFESKQVDENSFQIINKDYDLRGNKIAEIIDPDGLHIESSAAYLDALNRPTEIINALGDKTVITYEGLRQHTLHDGNAPDRLQIITKDAFMRDLTVTDWSGTNTIVHEYNDALRQHTVMPAEDLSRKVTEIANAFGEIEKHIQADRVTEFSHGVDGQLEKTVFPDGTEESKQFNLNGLLESVTDRLGKEMTLGYNAANQLQSVTDDVKVTQYKPNVFDLNEEEIKPDGMVVHRTSKKAGLILEVVQDTVLSVRPEEAQSAVSKGRDDGIPTLRDGAKGAPPQGERVLFSSEKLQLLTTQSKNLAGGIKRIEQGDVSDANQYQENIELDILNRAISTSLDMGNEKPILLKKQEWDASGHLLSVTDGKGNIQRNIYDVRGNLRFTIDGEGFVIEKMYDVNNQEIVQHCWAAPLKNEDHLALSAKTTPAELSAKLTGHEADAGRVRILDKDGLLCYELNAVKVDGGRVTFKIKGWQYNAASEVIQSTEYAKTFELGLTPFPTLTAINTLLQTEGFANHPRNRTIDTCRDQLGKGIFKRDGEGYVTEKRYDANGKVIARIRYAEKMTDVPFPQTPEKTVAKLNTTHPDNRTTYNVYDLFGNLRFTIDGETYVTEYQYDKQDRLNTTYGYVNKLDKMLDKTELAEFLNKLAESHDRISVLKVIKQTIERIKNSRYDISLTNEYDAAGRLIATIDGENKKESFKPNALGLNEKRIDKRNQLWEKQFNRAKQLVLDKSPAVELATVTYPLTAEGLILNLSPNQVVENTVEYDEALNHTKMIYASNIPDSLRSVSEKYDRKNQFIGTEMTQVTVDDGTSTFPTKDKNRLRPETIKTLTTSRVLDFAGRELVSINEKGFAQFTVFDVSGRERFRIDYEGYVSEFIYEDGFNEYTQLLQYQTQISQAVLEAHAQGFLLSECVDLVNQFKNAKDETRSLTLALDRRGLITNTKKDEIITATVSEEGEVKRENIRPEKTWQHNGFGEVIIEQDRLDQTHFAITNHFHDLCGNEVLTVDPRCFVTEMTYGMQHMTTNQKGSLELTRTEYAIAISPDQRQDKQAILKALTRQLNRSYEYTHDRRQLQTHVTTNSDQPFYDTFLSPQNTLACSPEKTSFTTGTEYDDAGDPIGYLLDNGDKRYLVRNARGEVIAETEFPMAVDINDHDKNGQPKKLIPFFKHYVNAHQQAVGTTAYANPAVIITDEDGYTLKEPVADITQDQTSLMLMDNRGQSIVMQSPEGHLKFVTYDECRQPVRSYHWVNGYQLINNIPTLIDHLRANRIEYNRRQQLIMQATIEDETQKETCNFRQINSFGECTGEGPAIDVMCLHRAFDKASNTWFTNEEKGIPTISFPNAKGNTTVTFRSQNNNLEDFLNDQEKASLALLEADYSVKFDQFQRTALLRDASGNVQKQFVPWYSQTPKDAPQYKQMSFTVQENPPGLAAGRYIAWQGPEEKFMVANFKLRVKGKEEWITLTEIPPATKPQSADLDIRHVNVSAFAADHYEFQLDFYYADPENQQDQTWPPILKYCDPLPSYRAEGEVMLDTKNYQNSQNPLWYMQDDNTLIITGKLDDISGVELIKKDGESYKRLAGTNKGEGRLVIDVSAEESGLYDFKFIYGLDEKPVEISLGQYGDYTLNHYQPIHKFTGPNSIQTIPGTYPPEITSITTSVMQAVAGMPSAPEYACQFGNGNDDFRVTVLEGDPLSEGILYGYGQDLNQPPLILGRYINSSHWVNGDTRWSGRNVADYTTHQGEPFLQLKSSAAVPPCALKLTDDANHLGTYQLLPFFGGTYRLPSTLTGNFKGSVITLADMKTSEVVGSLSLKTKKHAQLLTAQEITFNNFIIVRYLAGVCYGNHGGNQVWDRTSDYLNYLWATTLPAGYRVRVAHNSVNAVITEVPQGVYQVKVPWNYRSSPGMLSYSVITQQGDEIPMGINIAPTVVAGNGGPFMLKYYNSHAWFNFQHEDNSYYPNMYTLYLSPLPKGTLEFEIQMNTSIGKEIWTKPIFYRTQNGVAIKPGTLPAGAYQYRMKLRDANNQLIDLSTVGLLKSTDDWHTGTLQFNFGLQGHQIFTSKMKQSIRTMVKPVAASQYDRWNNPSEVISRANYAKGILNGFMEHYTEYKKHNHFGQETQTISPFVDATDEKDKTSKVRLVHQNLFNVNKMKIGELFPEQNPFGKAKLRFANTRGDTLMSQDEDMVTHINTIDILRRKISSEGMTSGKIISTFERKGELTIEKRLHPNGSTEELVFNQEGHCIRYQDQRLHDHYSDFDSAGHETWHINAKELNQDWTAQQQTFHARANLATSFTDEDGNTKTWSTQSEDPKDDYFGNVVSSTDFAGQVIKYLLNFNQQILAEKGSISEEVKQKNNRGRIVVNGLPDMGKDTPPPARDIVNLLNEAGLTVEVVDAGVNLNTRMRHDEDDFTIAYYFINNDGRVYQATDTEYDELHRIAKLHDTRYAVHMGYDKNSNRRFARAFIMGNDPHDTAFLRESWNTYTSASRPILRDGIFNEKEQKIQLAGSEGVQGTEFTREKGRITTQVQKTFLDEFRTKELKYRQDEDILTDIKMLETKTGREISSMHRETDAANRCWKIVQNTGCEVYIRAHQPAPIEYLSYEVPTLVLNATATGMGLYYYCKGQDPQNIKFDSDDYLYDEVAKKFDHIPYDQLSTDQLERMKAVINDYHVRIFGNSVTDTTTYTERDTIAVQVRNEKNGNKINTRSILEKTKSNRALTERNVLNDHLENEKKTPYSITDTLYTGYYEGEAIKVSNVVLADHIVGGDVEYDAFPKTAAVYTTANANGAITSVQGALPSDPDPTVLSETFRHFVSNSQDCIVFKESAKGRNYYFYAEKRPGKTVLMAYFGDLPEDIKIRLNKTGKAALNTERPAVINIDINHQAISPQYPPAMPSDYRVTSELTYNQLAEELNYTGYGEAIAHANQADGETLIKINTLVKIPPLYFEIAETAWNGSLPSIDRIIGSLYPSMPTPHLRMKDHSVPFNWVETFIEAAALVAIMCFAPELLAGVMGATLGSATVASTASLAVTAASYGGAAAIASTVDQGIAIGYGSRHGFDVKAIAISTVTAAVTAGVGQQLSQFNFAPSIFRGTVTGNVISNVVKAEGIAFAQQAVLVTTRLQKHFDWKALSAAAFNAVISTGTNAAFGADSAHAIIPMNKITYAGTDVLVNTVSNAALHHQRLSAEGLSASILGNMAGTYAGNKALDGILAMQQETLQVERMGEVGHERAKVGQQRRTANQHTMFAKTAAKTEKARNNPVKEVKAANGVQRKSVPAWEDQDIGDMGDYLSTNKTETVEKKRKGFFPSMGEKYKEIPVNLYKAVTNPSKSLAAIKAYTEDNLDIVSNPRLYLAKMKEDDKRFRDGVSAMYDEIRHGNFDSLGRLTADLSINLFPVGKVLRSIGFLGTIGKGIGSLAKTARFTELASGATKAEVRALLRSGELNLPAEQIDKLLHTLGGGRMDKVTLKLMNSGDVRLAAERSGAVNGYQRMSFEVDQLGRTNKVVQTAFDDANKLVPQRPGEFKNNLYDVKKWNKKPY